VVSLKLKHLDIVKRTLVQDAREVHTKRGKTIITALFPVGEEPLGIVTAWVEYLRTDLHFGPDDPLFPATHVALDGNRQFAPIGLNRSHWTTTAPVRKVFKDAFARAGLPYHNPHSFRSTLARLGEQKCRTPEDFKAWSQNLGHTGVLTTFSAYGKVAEHRQCEIITELGKSPQIPPDNIAALEAVLRNLKSSSQ
jgi:integrase